MSLSSKAALISDNLQTTNNNRAMIIKALTSDLKVKTLTILYNSNDSWNEHSQFASTEFIHANCIQAVLKDFTVLGYKTFFCKINADNTLTKTMESEPFLKSNQ